MIDWNQRAITIRAARRLVLALDDLVRDAPDMTAKEDQERLDKSFRGMYTQLEDLLHSLPLTPNEKEPLEQIQQVLRIIRG
jgi:hypothetical protein